MISLNQLASRVANIIGKPEDHSIKERAKDAFKNVFATRIRQSFERNGIDDLLLLTYSTELETNGKYLNYSIFKTKSPVLTPVRFRNDTPFVFVGAEFEDGSSEGIPFTYRSELELKLIFKKVLKGFLRAYTIKNNYMYLYVLSTYSDLVNVTDIKKVVITSVFENPEEVISTFLDTDSNDVALPFPSDMLESVLLEILKTEFGYNTPNNEVKS